MAQFGHGYFDLPCFRLWRNLTFYPIRNGTISSWLFRPSNPTRRCGGAGFGGFAKNSLFHFRVTPGVLVPKFSYRDSNLHDFHWYTLTSHGILFSFVSEFEVACLKFVHLRSSFFRYQSKCQFYLTFFREVCRGRKRLLSCRGGSVLALTTIRSTPKPQ